jgi:hypothetical protein
VCERDLGKASMIKRDSWWKRYRSRPVSADQDSLQRQSNDAIGWVARGPIWQLRPNRFRVRADQDSGYATENQFPALFPSTPPSAQGGRRPEEMKKDTV